MSETLDRLREAEEKARQEVDQARLKAASIRGAIASEISALGEEKNRRLAHERRRLEADVRKEVDALHATRLSEIAGRLDAVARDGAVLDARAVELLRQLLLRG